MVCQAVRGIFEVADGVVLAFRIQIASVENESSLGVGHAAVEFNQVHGEVGMPCHSRFDLDGD